MTHPLDAIQTETHMSRELQSKKTSPFEVFRSRDVFSLV